MMDWNELYQTAVETLNPMKLSKNADSGGVAAVLLTDRGNVYRGVCIDTPCSMGFCAEHAAAAAMVTAGEHRVVKMLAVSYGRQIIPPCGRCREFICQLHDENHRCEVKLAGRIATLDELLPDRWE